MDVAPWKPTKIQLVEAAGKHIPDVLAPNLQVLFCGINPGLYSGAVGHHFARPGNRFWPALHAGGFTQRLLSPFEEHRLLEDGYGMTNLVARATASAAELRDDEFRAGGRRLLRKLQRYRPRVVAFLGITAYRTAFNEPEAHLGRQDRRLAVSVAWLLPSPSGLNAHYQPSQLAQLFGELKTFLQEYREEPWPTLPQSCCS